MCDDGIEFSTEEALNQHISSDHFDLNQELKATGDKLTVLSTADVEAGLVKMDQVLNQSSVPSTSSTHTKKSEKSEKSSKSGGGVKPCEICGYEPKTKNKSRERSDHLAMKHYKERIEQDLAKIKDLKCPLCDFKGKDRQTIHRHYTGKHRVVENYLIEDIRNGRVLPLQKSVVNEKPKKDLPQQTANIQMQVIANNENGIPLINNEISVNNDRIMQVDGAFDFSDDEEKDDEYLFVQVDGAQDQEFFGENDDGEVITVHHRFKLCCSFSNIDLI